MKNEVIKINQIRLNNHHGKRSYLIALKEAPIDP